MSASYNVRNVKAIEFVVYGEPVPKQSYRAVKGGGYTDPRVKAWQAAVAWFAREAMAGCEPLTGSVTVYLDFGLGNSRRVDLDNLSKGVLDALNGIVFKDDSQVAILNLMKRVDEHPGVFVLIWPGIWPFEQAPGAG